jgi:DNA-directed RNA polymerase specialized sigma24 family protein
MIEADLEALALRAASGEPAARQKLVELLWPAWLEMVRSSRNMGTLGRSDDHVREVATRLAEKMARPGARELRLYPAWRKRHPEKTFMDWIRIVTKNVIRDYVRQRHGPTRMPRSEVSSKRLLNEFAAASTLDKLGEWPPITPTQTARELVEFARRQLPLEQLQVLSSWLEGASFESIAEEFALTPAEARKLLRAGVATLRRNFL